ncbi:uncharacterized protein [Triticum aestivum]|uniref:uncharacterized protein n=1 Tax=Triticum aestivum TaxID=4565 RepID=UPI001D012883|nr:uncharacterized protein LOC123041686 [Triticum aestivum]
MRNDPVPHLPQLALPDSSCDELAAPPPICPRPHAPCLKIWQPRHHPPPDQAAAPPPFLDPAAVPPARGDAKPSCSSIGSHRGDSGAPSLPLFLSFLLPHTLSLCSPAGTRHGHHGQQPCGRSSPPKSPEHCPPRIWLGTRRGRALTPRSAAAISKFAAATSGGSTDTPLFWNHPPERPSALPNPAADLCT